MDRNKSDIGIQVKVMKHIIERDRLSLLIQRGAIALVIALILAIAIYLAVLDMLDGLSVWKALTMLLFTSLAIGAVILEEREKRKLRKKIEELEKEKKHQWIFSDCK